MLGGNRLRSESKHFFHKHSQARKSYARSSGLSEEGSRPPLSPSARACAKLRRVRTLSSYWTRRRFIGACGAVTAGFLAYRNAFERSIDALASVGQAARGYGPLVEDPAKVIDLPQGFRYKVVSHAGDEMPDGLLVPGLPDAMATFAGTGSQVIVVRNHECLGTGSAFGPGNERLSKISA